MAYAVNVGTNQSGVGITTTLPVPLALANVGGSVDILTNYRPSYSGRIVQFDFRVNTPVTTNSKLLTATLYVNSVAVAAIALTSALATPLGAIIASSGITGNPILNIGDTISIKATGVTAFVEGSGEFYVQIQQTGNSLP